MVNFFRRNAIGMSLLFVIIPIIIFLFGFLKIYIAIPFTLLISICYYRVLKSEKLEEYSEIFDKKSFIICAILILIWLYFSGIGGFSFQNSDWEVRNAVFNDLVNYDWPVIFSTSEMMHSIEELNGIDKIGFVYYFTYWLPAAILGKLFGLTVAKIVLFIWTFSILMTTVYLMKKFLKKNIFLILYFFIFFSGMDILGISGNGIKLFDIEHIESWCPLLQYSSNTTQLYWVFNQSVMSWLITILILNVKSKFSVLFISSMIFCYSPFATFGMIPVALYLVISKCLKEDNKKKSFLKLIFSFETLNAIFLLIVFGTFYLSADNSISTNGFIWNMQEIVWYKVYVFYILEFLVFVFFMIKDEKNNGLFWGIFTELLLIPLYRMTPANDFCMRGSIVPLFVLMIYFIKYISNFKEKNVFVKSLICLIVIISFVTPAKEISRSVYYTNKLMPRAYTQEKIIYSIGNPLQKPGLYLCNYQFYNRDLENNFFSKYLLKKNY